MHHRIVCALRLTQCYRLPHEMNTKEQDAFLAHCSSTLLGPKADLSARSVHHLFGQIPQSAPATSLKQLDFPEIPLRVSAKGTSGPAAALPAIGSEHVVGEFRDGVEDYPPIYQTVLQRAACVLGSSERYGQTGFEDIARCVGRFKRRLARMEKVWI